MQVDQPFPHSSQMTGCGFAEMVVEHFTLNGALGFWNENTVVRVYLNNVLYYWKTQAQGSTAVEKTLCQFMFVFTTHTFISVVF